MSDYAYRNTDPDAIAAWHTTAQRHREASNQALTGAKAIGKNKGLMAQRSIGEQEFVGLAPIDPTDPPEGWRYVRDRFEPRRGKAGDDARAWLKSVQLPDLRDVMQQHGLPKILFKGGMMRAPAMFEHDGAVYALYSAQPDDIGPLWEPIRLSEFYAAQEASDETSRAAA
ncbi:hypothetical protein FHR83_006659 [Actinoplanes campanulatus]|uniref:Uncharacterized protein n=1 Tax=Actinoplanes campanulatus TaxID=113559 RepID=A0A7W5AME1_9ACTN|nr:hypothetical protein [Actinoplanes campanulatus]MBB3098953.1 hypothetical protein [Actinoplanes campanulatus]GGN39705.1 hypothetical protein GCM10010109_67970 [Actinoplanes campanulatus]